MTDEFALLIVAIGVIALIIVTVRSHGKYEDQIPLGPGSYVVGYDIDPGKCDIKAVTGGGNFTVHNRVAKAWNLGGALGVTSGLQPSRFRNLRLGRGDVLEIDGNVTMLLTPPVPIKDPDVENLCIGVYRFGLDVPQGRYDIEIVSGDGDVLLVEVNKDEYVFYQDMSFENPFKASSFKNIDCGTNFELWVNGSLVVKLKRSERQLWFLRFLKALGLA